MDTSSFSLEDFQELERLAAQSDRPLVRAALQSAAAAGHHLKPTATTADVPPLNSESESIPSAVPSAPDAPTESTPAHPTPSVAVSSSILAAPAAVRSFEVISRFLREDEISFTKLFVDLPGVGSLPESSVSATFDANGFDIKVIGLNGKNYHFCRRHLYDRINASQCTVVRKPNKFIVKLVKAQHLKWAALEKKEEKSSLPPKMDDSDPSAGIMGLLKNMYAEGDPDMKRMIAKAWTESRDKQGHGSSGLPDF